jgi:hypothetical protein
VKITRPAKIKKLEFENYPVVVGQFDARVRLARKIPRAAGENAARRNDTEVTLAFTGANCTTTNYPARLKYCTARSCFLAAAREENVPRFFLLPVFASFFFEYKRYSPECNFRIMKNGCRFRHLRLEDNASSHEAIILRSCHPERSKIDRRSSCVVEGSLSQRCFAFCGKLTSPSVIPPYTTKYFAAG